MKIIKLNKKESNMLYHILKTYQPNEQMDDTKSDKLYAHNQIALCQRLLKELE
jgi:hypothetical protein